MSKVIVVGAGLSGATVARKLAEAGHTVTVLDKRGTIGGNVYDYIDKNGIRVQQYGPHVFHTESDEVFEFLSNFTSWVDYEHKVLANVKGKLVPVPFNLNSLRMLFPTDRAERIEKTLIEEFGAENSVSVLDLKKHENPEIRDFAEYVYNNIYYFYTKKRWGAKPEDLLGTVMNRVPVHLSTDDRYFKDKHLCMPQDGFTSLVTKMLAHHNIQLKLNTDAKKILTLLDGELYLNGKKFDGTVVYTGCVDELFDNKFGLLPYRSMKFKLQTKKCSSFQKAAVINYTTFARFMRTTEFSKFTCEEKDNTVILKEYSRKFKKGKNVPYFPIPIQNNQAYYGQYVVEAKKYKNLYLLGRLANYKYIDMDVAVQNALELSQKLLKKIADDEE